MCVQRADVSPNITPEMKWSVCAEGRCVGDEVECVCRGQMCWR